MARIQVDFRLRELLCHKEFDEHKFSEPYVWVAYIRLDWETYSFDGDHPLGLVVPPFPHLSIFPGGIEAGDRIPIPGSVGTRSIIIDDGEYGLGACGFIIALLEHDETKSSALEVGYSVFAKALTEKLNELLVPRINELVLKAIGGTLRRREIAEVVAISDDEMKELKATISKRVRNAVKGQLSAWEKLFLNHDDFIDVNFKVFLSSDLAELIAERGGVEEFTLHLEENRTLPTIPPTVMDQDYELFGSVRARTFEPPVTDPCQHLRDLYTAAAKVVVDIKIALSELQKALQTASGTDKELLIFEIKDIIDSQLPIATSAADEAWASYQKCSRPSSGPGGTVVVPVRQ